MLLSRLNRPEFGRFAAADRRRRGEGKPETFAFLGFTHICDQSKSGKFTVRRQTMRQRLQAKLDEVNRTAAAPARPHP